MLKYCAGILTSHAPRTGPAFAVVMESFLVHARNLNHFFYATEIARESTPPKAIRLDDVIVEDYFESSAHHWLKPLDNRLSRDELQKVNRQLAHLSYSRVVTNRESWDFQKIEASLTATYDLFIRSVPKSRLHPRLLSLHHRNHPQFGE